MVNFELCFKLNIGAQKKISTADEFSSRRNKMHNFKWGINSMGGRGTKIVLIISYMEPGHDY